MLALNSNSLVLMKLQNSSVNLEEVATLITVQCRSPDMNINDLSDLARKEVVFPANNFNTGPVDGSGLCP